MGKKIAIGVGVLVLAVAVAVGVVLGQLGRIIKKGVETAGPPITGTAVSLGGARVSIFSGDGALRRLRVGNPKGFSDADAFDLSRIAISLDPKSVASGVVHVRSIVIDGPQLLAEFDAAGRNNLNRIMDNVKAAAGGSGGGKAAGGKDAGKPVKLIVDEFRFVNAQVRVTSPAYQLDRQLKLPPIVVRGIGGKQGVTPSEAASQVMRPVVSAALQAAMDEYVRAQRDKLGDKAKEGLLNKLFK